MQKGASVEVVTPGAGGYGPAEKRDPAHVRADLDDGRISEETARMHYAKQLGDAT